MKRLLLLTSLVMISTFSVAAKKINTSICVNPNVKEELSKVIDSTWWSKAFLAEGYSRRQETNHQFMTDHADDEAVICFTSVTFSGRGMRDNPAMGVGYKVKGTLADVKTNNFLLEIVTAMPADMADW